MGYKLSKLTVENFVVFVNRTDITFSTSMINNIEGICTDDLSQSNGAGKSLIIDAISLALFGKGVRTQYISDYISQSNKSNGIYLGLELIDEQQNILKIERWRRPGSETNKAKLWHKGVCISQDSTISKIDEAVGSFIGISHSNFLSCVFSVMVPGFLKLRPAQRFEILEQALAVKKIESVIKKINTTLKDTADKLDATLDSLQDKSSALSAEKVRHEIYTNNSDSLKTAIEAQKAEILTLLEEESSKVTELTQFNNLLTEVSAKITPLDNELHTLLAERHMCLETISKLEKKMAAMLATLKKTAKGTVECAVCKSQLDSSSRESVKTHYKDEIAISTSRVSELDALISKQQTKLEKLIASKQKIEHAIRLSDKGLKFVQTNILALEKTLHGSREALKTAKQSFDNVALQSLKKEVVELADLRDSYRKEKKICEAWKQAMSKNGLRLSYIKEEISTLNALASKFCSAVYEKPMHVKFYISEDKDTPSLDFSVNGKNANMFSTGEGRRLEIAITLSLTALLRTSGLTLDFLILDEALDGLSVSSKQAVLKVIDSLSSDYQVVMISHDSLIKQRSGYVIEITKDVSTATSKIKTLTR